jgi:hypothetical protein
MQINLSIITSLTCIFTLSASAAEPQQLAIDSYNGYFVSNKFEPDARESFLAIKDQKGFDHAFGAGFVMHDKSHRLAKNAFDTQIVVAAIKRGAAMWTYTVESATVADGVVTIKYSATEKKSDSAKFACPLIVSIPKGEYKEIKFVENGKEVKTLALP